MDLTMLLFFGLAILLFGGTIIFENINKKRDIEIELELRRNDSLLQKYFAEMNNDRNDGWWKLHYAEKYKQRLNKLKEDL
jgi:hypothetical protein